MMILQLAARGESEMKAWQTKTILILVFTFLYALQPGIRAGEDRNQSFINDGELDVDAVVEYFEDLYRWDRSLASAELTVTKPRRTRTMSMRIWSKGRDRALIVIDSPPREKGTATLKVDKNLWNYLPRIKRTVRIPPSMMLASWMGSDFSNDDLVRESSYSEDYTYRLAGQSEEPAGWVIEFTAKPDVVGLWSRIVFVFSTDGTLPLAARYYDRKDRLSRSMVWDRVEVFDGRRIPSRLTLVPNDKEGYKTVMVYNSISFNEEIPDSTFSLSRLERSR
jgi:outer membrane lipoprotein-sorting protein